MTLSLSIPEPATLGMSASDDWAGRIRDAWNETREGVIQVGRLLMAAKAALKHGEFEDMIGHRLPFTPSTAQRLMKIAGDARLMNPAHVQLLPPSWGTLYELTKLDDGTFSHALAEGLIRPDMERKEAERLRTAGRREERLARTEALAKGSPLPASMLASGRRYPVVYADPPWRFETWSDLGQEKAAENHYPTMTYDRLARLPVSDLAAEDAVLFLWTTGPHLWAAVRLLDDWNFAYKSHCCWSKRAADGSPHRGHGYWFIDSHELLLVGARGNIPAPMPGTQELSLIEAPIGRHSEKPARFREIIDRYFPGVGKIELFARPPLPEGWDCWGNEVKDKIHHRDTESTEEHRGDDPSVSSVSSVVDLPSTSPPNFSDEAAK